MKKNGPERIFNFNMLFAREFLHIFIRLVGIFDVFFHTFEKGGGGVVVCTCSVLAIMYVRNTNLSIADVTESQLHVPQIRFFFVFFFRF